MWSLFINIEEIRKNAPDGATHYSRQIDRYLKYEKNKIYLFRFGGWLLEHGLPPNDTTPIGQLDLSH